MAAIKNRETKQGCFELYHFCRQVCGDVPHIKNSFACFSQKCVKPKPSSKRANSQFQIGCTLKLCLQCGVYRHHQEMQQRVFSQHYLRVILGSSWMVPEVKSSPRSQPKNVLFTAGTTHLLVFLIAPAALWHSTYWWLGTCQYDIAQDSKKGCIRSAKNNGCYSFSKRRKSPHQESL